MVYGLDTTCGARSGRTDAAVAPYERRAFPPALVAVASARGDMDFMRVKGAGGKIRSSLMLRRQRRRSARGLRLASRHGFRFFADPSHGGTSAPVRRRAGRAIRWCLDISCPGGRVCCGARVVAGLFPLARLRRVTLTGGGHDRRSPTLPACPHRSSAYIKSTTGRSRRPPFPPLFKDMTAWLFNERMWRSVSPQPGKLAPRLRF